MKRILFLGGFLLCLLVSNAQFIRTEPCATMVQDSISRARFPQRGTLEEFEEAIQIKIREMRSKPNGRTMAGVVSLPIIVHIVHNGEAVGTGTNISQAQVQSQIAVLNEDFRRMLGTPGYNTNPVGADIEIEFCLSPVDENGVAMAEPGIHRYNGGRSDWSRDQIENLLKPSSIWNPNLFFNIWTVKFAAADANLVGYAQFPDKSGLTGLPASGPESTDGVVIRYQSFGSVDKGNFPVLVSPYNKGRTLSHETGHWLGLRHIWGDGPCADDFVSDTPSADGPSSGCPVGRISCGGVNMVENYMDYSNDACMNIFTLGQKTRMQAVIQISPRRKTLIDANLCNPPVASIPVANFTVDNQLVLLGGEASFTDLSSNFPTSWSWQFDGGDPAVSTVRNPKVKYATPGIYRVSLVSTNSLGSSIPFEVINYITVSDQGLCSSVNNFNNTFTSSLVRLSKFGNYSGFLAGHNSLKSKGVSEYFSNNLGYRYLSGVNIRFGKAYSLKEDAVMNVVVWNARGPQNAPGSVIERKVVLLKQIMDDIANNQTTTVVFDRETPVFSKPFQVGIELSYAGDSLAIVSSASGEALNATSWIEDVNGVWRPMSIAFGANIAMDIQPFIGMNPSVQVSASVLLAAPGQQVILNGRGASVFVWNSNDGVITDYTGPQLIVYPEKTTTYTILGSGLTLCNGTATTTIYVSNTITGVQNHVDENSFFVFPNPGVNEFSLELKNNYQGIVEITLSSMLGQEFLSDKVVKEEQTLTYNKAIPGIAPGLYIIRLKLGSKTLVSKWISQSGE